MRAFHHTTMKLEYSIPSIRDAIESGRSDRSKSAFEQTQRAIRALLAYFADVHENVFRTLDNDPTQEAIERELRIFLFCGAYTHRQTALRYAHDALEFGDSALLDLLRALPRAEMPDILERSIRQVDADPRLNQR